MRKAAVIAMGVVTITGAALASMVRFTDSPAEPPTDPVPVVAAALLRERAPVLPVAGMSAAQLTDTWGQSRGGGARAHQGIDVMAPRGTPVRAIADGVVEKLFLSRDGGITLYQRSRDRSLSFYYAHLAGYAPGVAEGARVSAGQTIGYVGDTGNAGAGNTHLHFGVHRMEPADRWWGGEALNPYPLLAGKGPER